ncbi:MAG: 4Fe-4S ferredoxin [Deltaproteobacteria bacterium]|nr:4Fe-4S ferredoxin [Deltaproteobacteria bacterium]
MKIKRKIIKIDEELCNGCGQCVTGCAEAALQIIDGKARLVAEKFCDGLGACLGECPTGALKIIEREADDFDEKAVEEFLKAQKEKSPSIPCGCPSATLRSFPAATSCQAANQPRDISGQSASALSHWPVQIRLVPATAPFLEKSDLLIVADCAPLAYPDFHRDFIQDRVVMMGCPKFDNQESYIEKFTEIFQTRSIKSITSVIMEVPCCGSMRAIIGEALRRAGRTIQQQEFVISARGVIL